LTPLRASVEVSSVKIGATAEESVS